MAAAEGGSGRSVTALEAFVGRHAWKIFTGLSTLTALFGFGDAIVGGATFVNGESVLFRTVSGTTWPELQSAQPGAANLIDYMVRAGGLHLLVLGLLSLAISLTALRRRERWAWYAMTAWIVWLALIPPMLLMARRDQEAGVPIPVISGSILLVVALLTLALSFRSYARSG